MHLLYMYIKKNCNIINSLCYEPQPYVSYNPPDNQTIPDTNDNNTYSSNPNAPDARDILTPIDSNKSCHNADNSRTASYDGVAACPVDFVPIVYNHRPMYCPCSIRLFSMVPFRFSRSAVEDRLVSRGWIDRVVSVSVPLPVSQSLPAICGE